MNMKLRISGENIRRRDACQGPINKNELSNNYILLNMISWRSEQTCAFNMAPISDVNRLQPQFEIFDRLAKSFHRNIGYFTTIFFIFIYLI